jgi:acetylornithine deacetylase/succinyl-diaminopimelate desuccinylase-like protein
MSVDLLRRRIQQLMPQAKQELTRMVSFQSVFDPRTTPPQDCHDMVDYTIELFTGVGLGDVQGYETSDGSTAICGHAPGPPGAPTVLLYFHHDVQPPLDDDAWQSPVWELTERDGRWYGRGTADCKGNIVTHLAALRALQGNLPVGVKIVGEGSEELGAGGLEDFVPRHADLLRADVILICDTGNAAVGEPALTTTLRGVAAVTVTVRTLSSPMHSGKFGGAAPDALAALIQMLATLRDEQGNTTIRGLDNTQTWSGAKYPPEQFRQDANVLAGVDLLGDDVSDMIWARPAITVLGIDCPPVVGSSAAVQAEARARVSLRVPAGMDANQAQDALVAHLLAVAPWHAHVDVERGMVGQPFTGTTSSPAFTAMAEAMVDVYGRQVTIRGSGGSIPLCNVFQETFPDAEIMLLGVEEPRCLIHAPNESVDPTEIENMALVEALFLQKCAATPRNNATSA